MVIAIINIIIEFICIPEEVHGMFKLKVYYKNKILIYTIYTKQPN